MSAIRSIRRDIFGMTQAEFAAVAGVAQASVSRWESGTPLSYREMSEIRAAAAKRGLKWDDSWFFDGFPHASSSVSEVASRETAR